MSAPCWIFEEAWGRDLFRTLYPHIQHVPLLTWNEWLETVEEPESLEYQQARSSFIASLAEAPKAETGDWLITLEELREAPLRYAEDAEFCFSHLPETQKNQFLKTVLLLYLNSELAVGDRAARSLRVLERLRVGELELSEDTLFIKARKPSHLFFEIARGKTTETWDLPVEAPQAQTRGALRLEFERTVDGLDRLALKARRLRDRGATLRLHYDGPAGGLLYLQSRLASHAIGDITVLPFHPFPMESGTTTLCYFEDQPESLNALALDASERRALRKAGFILAEAQPAKERLCERITALFSARSGRRLLFAKPDLEVGGSARRSVRYVPPLALAPAAAPSLLSDAITGNRAVGTLTATALELYAQCPAKYFFEQQLRLRPRQEASRLFALWFGMLTHRALEQAYQQTQWHDLDTAALEAAFEKTLEAEEKIREPAWLAVALRTRFRQIARVLPAMETHLRTQLGTLTPSRFEQDFEVPFEKWKLRGRMDRVDRTQDGHSLVIDYKTGTVDFSPEHVRRGLHFQAWVYLLAAEALFEKPLGALFFDLKQGQTKRGMLQEVLIGKDAKKAFTRGHALSPENWQAVLNEGANQARLILKKMETGDWTPSPAPASCEYCDLGTHCRVRTGWIGGSYASKERL